MKRSTAVEAYLYYNRSCIHLPAGNIFIVFSHFLAVAAARYMLHKMYPSIILFLLVQHSFSGVVDLFSLHSFSHLTTSFRLDRQHSWASHQFASSSIARCLLEAARHLL